MISRHDQFKKLYPNEPAFRWKQMEQALFVNRFSSWQDVTSLSKPFRENLHNFPWTTVQNAQIFSNKTKDTFKAALQFSDNQWVETVLMRNPRDQLTICVSSQIGCPMGCAFCATGKMGLSRSLIADEIVDQYRFWKKFMPQKLEGEITNIVFMGMGEPLLNYEAIKESIHTWLRHTLIGKTHITVSTVGVLPTLKKILEDPTWPDVRLAISLHSADLETRKRLMPSTATDFIEKLIEWAHGYTQKYGNRRHHLTFEYVMLSGINDTNFHAQKLAELGQKIDQVRVNLIPYNFTNSPFQCSPLKTMEHFQRTLKNAGLTVTIRKSKGDDIAAACGQLIQM